MRSIASSSSRYPRQHNHYLKGTVYCGDCKSRLMICNARNRHGKIYPLLRLHRPTPKTHRLHFRAILIERVEDKVIDHYASQQLAPDVRQALGDTLAQEFEAVFAEAAAERKLLTTRKKQLLAERSKLLKAHLADAVPLDFLKTEQARIGAQLAYIEQRLSNTEHEHSTGRQQPQPHTRLLGDLQAAYEAAAFDTILDRALHQRALEIARDETPLAPATTALMAVTEPDWELGKQASMRART